MKTLRASHWVLFAVFVLLLLAVGTALLLRNRGAAERVAPRYGPVIESIYGLGTVKAERDFDVKLGVSGRAIALHVREGQRVRRGDPLIRFDDTDTIRAPFDGVVTSLPVHLEDMVYPQQSALHLEDLAHRYVEVSVEQRGALRIHRGQPARLVFESIRSERYEGRVNNLYPRSGDFVARIDATDLPETVLPGMTADVAIARALIMDPKYIFADEPTGNLDSQNGLVVMEILKRANLDRNATVVLVTHEPDFAAMARREIRLVDGRQVQG